MSKAVKSSREKTKSKNYEVYFNIRKEGWNLLMHASLAFDSAMTILSAAFLGFVFSVTKEQLIAGSVIQCKGYLILVLVMLTLCVFVSLISLWFDQRYGSYLMSRADKVHLEGDLSYQNKSHWSYFAALTSKIVSGILFGFAIIIFLIFFIVNIDNGTAENKSSQKQQINSQVSNSLDGVRYSVKLNTDY